MTGRKTSILTGRWWKFDRYELRDGMIRPARGATLSLYDPLEGQDPESPVRQDRVPPYRSLIDVVNRLKYSKGDSAHDEGARLHPRSERELLDWCEENGLLGMLLHDALLITLAPRVVKRTVKESRSIARSWRRAGFNEEPPREKTLQKSYIRTTFGWVEIDQPVDSKWRLRNPGILALSYTGSGLSEQSLINLSHYFPSGPRREDDKAWLTFECPRPMSERFWKLYAEPLDRLVERVGFLQLAIASMTGSTNGNHSLSKAATLRVGRQYLQGLLSPVGLGYAIDPEAGVRPRLIGGSLLSMLAAMALQDAPKGRVLQCAVCGTIFIAGKREQTRYCTKRCRATAQKRANRQKEKEKGEKI